MKRWAWLACDGGPREPSYWLMTPFLRLKTKPTPEQVYRWVIEHAAMLNMSEKRAIDIINEGNGEWPGANMRWWRGVSVT